MFLFRLVTFYLGVMLMFFSVWSLVYGLSFYFGGKVLFLEWELISIYSSVVIMTFLLDWMSLTFMGFVLLISSMVLFYSTSYMTGDKFFYRFILLVYLFVISMLLLILSPNLISILLGWDGLGLVSYCLVIYYQNEKSANAGMLTILSNRVGDVAILLSIAWLVNYGSWNFYYLQFVTEKSELLFILVLVTLAAMTKSAQIPFSAWLPAAMAAPTPVSALVHSSTLVTAGVYLMIRFETLLGVNSFLFVTGSITMFMSGLGANFETDLKKIIALSTLSQLGVMMMILGLGMAELAFFHLLSHALFKSLLFLCAGVFIHGMGDIQDIRFLGGVEHSFPVSSFYFVACSLALCGFPFLAGFYSKDMILEYYFLGGMNFFLMLFVILGTFFTVSYSFRLGYFLVLKNLGLKSMVSLEEDKVMIFSMTSLFVLAVSAGSLLSWQYFPNLYIFLPPLFKSLLLVGTILVSMMVFFVMEDLKFYMESFFSSKIHFFGTMWFMPILSTIFIMPALKVGKTLLSSMDQGWVEYWGGQGVFTKTSKTGSLVDYSFMLGIKSYLFLGFMILLFFSLLF